MSLSKVLHDAMHKKGLTTLSLAARLEKEGVAVTAPAVNYWLVGRNLPRAEYAPALCRILDIDPAAYIEACGPDPAKSESSLPVAANQ